MEKADDNFIIFPIHLDASVSLSKGRRYSLAKTIQKPTYKEIKNALEKADIKFVAEEDKIHPKEIKEKGRFVVSEKSERAKTISSVVDLIKESRNKKEKDIEKSGYTKNLLNLKPRSKKKSKK